MNKTADPGNVFVCLACGKRSRSRYGFQPVGEGLLRREVRDSISPGWDESCMLNCDEFPEGDLVLNGIGRVTEIKRAQ